MKTNTYETFLFSHNYLFIHSFATWNLISALLVLIIRDSTPDSLGQWDLDRESDPSGLP